MGSSRSVAGGLGEKTKLTLLNGVGITPRNGTTTNQRAKSGGYMVDSISNFFEAWAIANAELREEKIKGAVAADVQYVDPRTPETLHGMLAVNDYVSMFSAYAPGWSAKVIKRDIVGGVYRVTVAFSGAGVDGSVQTQLGQYFVEKDGELISRMVGFVGTGD